MIKGKLTGNKGLSIDKGCAHYKDEELEIYVTGHIYNLQSKNIAKEIAEAFEAKGYSIFSQLDGSFTILIYMPYRTIIVRDHHGINYQIYYTQDSFSSSLYELTRAEEIDKTPDYNSLASFLTAGQVSAPHTSFAHISKLEAGHLLEVTPEAGTTVINLFPPEEARPATAQQKSVDEYAEEFYTLHKQAIQRRIAGNDKVGMFLSGGYDSGANLIALRELYPANIDTFSIGFKGDSKSELPRTRMMAEAFDATYHEYEIDGSEIAALPGLIRNLGDPFAECGMMINYSVFKLSGKDYPGVLIGGEGNDDYFSTSNRQIALNYLMGKYGLTRPMTHLKNYLDQDKFDKDGLLFRVNFHLETALNILESEVFGFPRYQVNQLLRDKQYLLDPPTMKPDRSSYENLSNQYRLKKDIERLNRIIIFKSSKMAEIFHSHVAYPFVDLELYHFMNNLPIDLRHKGDSLLAIARGKGINKYLHKYVYAPKMPKLEAKTQGGFVPMEIFFKNEPQRKRMAQIVLDSALCSEFLNKQEVERFFISFEKEINEPVKWFWYRQVKCNRFFNLLSLAIWWEEFIKGRAVSI